MAALILLLVIAAIAVAATVVTVARDGYRRVPTVVHDTPAVWPPTAPVPVTRLG